MRSQKGKGAGLNAAQLIRLQLGVDKQPKQEPIELSPSYIGEDPIPAEAVVCRPGRKPVMAFDLEKNPFQAPYPLHPHQKEAIDKLMNMSNWIPRPLPDFNPIMVMAAARPAGLNLDAQLLAAYSTRPSHITIAMPEFEKDSERHLVITRGKRRPQSNEEAAKYMISLDPAFGDDQHATCVVFDEALMPVADSYPSVNKK